jgi:hypothetical protein
VDALIRVMGALLRRSAALVPADRREWAEAVWAEAGAVPAGRRRLGWLAGGLWMTAKQARTARRIGGWLLFGAGAAGVVRIGWPGASGSPATLINRVDVIVIVVMLAGLPWAARRLVGPAGSSRLARVLRACGYAAILALVVAKASAERFGNPPSHENELWPALSLWTGEVLFLAMMVIYAGWIVAVTARRSPATPATLAVGVGAGGIAGLVMYVRANLHLTGSGLAGVVVAATVLVWIVLVGAPILAGVAAGRRARDGGEATTEGEATAGDPARQGLAAGLSAGMAAALLVSVLGTGMVALLPHETGLLYWAYPVRHLAPGALYRFEVNVSQNASAYLIVLMLFPLLGAGLGAWAGMATASLPGHRPGGGGPRRPAAPIPPPGSGGRGFDRPPVTPRSSHRVIQPPPGIWQAPEHPDMASDQHEPIPVGSVVTRATGQ